MSYTYYESHSHPALSISRKLTPEQRMAERETGLLAHEYDTPGWLACQLGRRVNGGTRQVPAAILQPGERSGLRGETHLTLNVGDLFELVAFGATWPEAIARWNELQPKRAKTKAEKALEELSAK